MAMPKNPIGSTVITDEQGTCTAFHKACKSCQVELTSRNRPGDGRLQCKACAASKARDVWNDAQVAKASAPPQPSPQSSIALEQPAAAPAIKNRVEALHTMNPAHLKVHALLTKFLLNPTIKTAKDDLLAGLLDYEIKELIRFR